MYEQEVREIFGSHQQRNRMMLPYRIAIETVKTKLESLDDEMKCTMAHSPIHNIKSRVKTPESIVEKLYRKNYDISYEGVQRLTDISGVRVICRYVDDIFYVAQLLLLQDDISLVRKTNYIQYPKPNGYRSLHLIVSVPVYLKDGMVQVPVEIQIRTIAMDMWASLEHNLHYKCDYEENDDINQRLKNCAETIAKTDIEMQNIYRELNSKWSKEES